MASELILRETRGRVGIVTLNRPDSLNALTGEMRTTMRATIGEWNEDPGVGAIVITGAGRAFSAGADVSSFQRPPADNGSQTAPGPEAQVSPWAGFARGSKPIVCAINGVAVGEGVTMTLPCDVRLAAPDARLSFRFVRLGLTPEIGSSHVLSHLTGLGRAVELMLTGRFFTGRLESTASCWRRGRRRSCWTGQSSWRERSRRRRHGTWGRRSGWCTSTRWSGTLAR